MSANTWKVGGRIPIHDDSVEILGHQASGAGGIACLQEPRNRHSSVRETQSDTANPRQITCLDWPEDRSAARQPLHTRGVTVRARSRTAPRFGSPG